MAAPKVLNVNVGVMGHVDSGKTALTRALSTELSTAALDKHPQSRERGITLDLGFSAFFLDLPDHMKGDGHDIMQVTLVDCPGHASLIRTVLGGAAIIDCIVLVIDVTKGIQTQTAECIVVGEIMCNDYIIVLNKVDLLPEATRAAQIEKVKKKLGRVFAQTKLKNAPMVAVAANPGADGASAALHLEELSRVLLETLPRPKRNVDGPFLFEFDHCFAIKGKGTVVTGTVLQGSVAVGDEVELPLEKLPRKVKSMQMFKRPINRISQGDRAGICINALDAGKWERGLLASPGAVDTYTGGIMLAERVRFFKNDITTGAKFHVTVGHQTVMATASFFHSVDLADDMKLLSVDDEVPFPADAEYAFAETLHATDNAAHRRGTQWALLEFEQPVTCPMYSIMIASRLDTDIHLNTCRLAFYGRMLQGLHSASEKEALKVFKVKTKRGAVDRVADDYTLVGRGMFGKKTDIQIFVGLTVQTEAGTRGTIEGAFGKSGKFKVVFSEPHGVEGGPLTLEWRRYVWAPDAKHTFVQ